MHLRFNLRFKIWDFTIRQPSYCLMIFYNFLIWFTYFAKQKLKNAADKIIDFKKKRLWVMNTIYFKICKVTIRSVDIRYNFVPNEQSFEFFFSFLKFYLNWYIIKNKSVHTRQDHRKKIAIFWYVLSFLF